MVSREIIEIVERFIKEIENEGIRVGKVFLYGSYAWGQAREDSDIDVAVVSCDFEKDAIEENMRLWEIAVVVDVRLAPLALAESDLEKLHIPIVAEVQKGIDLTPAAA